MVFGGDFRQILPVVKKAKRSETVAATLKSSPLWSSVEQLKLSGSMRLESDDVSFLEFMMCVGNGQLQTDDHQRIPLPHHLLVPTLDSLIEHVYPDFLSNSQNVNYLTGRALLCTTNRTVNKLNELVLGMLEGPQREYLSADSLIVDEGTINHLLIGLNENLYPPEFLHNLESNGVPPHKLTLKVGCPILLIRNLDSVRGLCNGTRLMVISLHSSVIEAEILVGTHKGQRVMIPRIDFIPENKELPFQYRRRQFPIRVCYAMTINKAQGQTLGIVGLILTEEVFAHGQLYVALSRVKNARSLKVLLDVQTQGKTKNIVYTEVLN